MNNKKVIILITFIMFILFQSDIKANGDYARICKYQNLQTNEDVFLHWNSKGVKLQVGNADPKTIVYNSDEYKLFGGTSKVFASGCPKYMNYGSFWKTYYFSDKPDNSKVVYEFKGVINEERDIYHSDTYEKEGVSRASMSCSYTISDGSRIVVQVDAQGKVANSKNAKITNVYEFMSIIDNKFRCPTTICYNKNILTDKITFSDDVNYECPSVIDGYTNSASDRESQLSTNFFGAPSETEKLEGEILKKEKKAVLNTYSSCLESVDSSEQKCSAQLGSMKSFCQDPSSENCTKAQGAFTSCVESNYDAAEINRVCRSSRNEFNELDARTEDYEKRTGININREIGLDGSAEVDYNYENPDCSTILGGEFVEWLSGAFKVIQIGAIIFTVVTAILGYAGAIMSSDNDAIKKATKNFKTRLIITVVLLLLPVIIEFILGLVSIPGLTNTNPLCK